MRMGIGMGVNWLEGMQWRGIYGFNHLQSMLSF